MAIIRRLSPFCEVLHFRRGRFDFVPGVCNGLRHYRVRVLKPIPSFLRFGKILLFLKHEGQVPTCRRCNQPGHFSNQCTQKICFNCDNLGHEAPACPASVLCSICKSDNHLAKLCPYSWYSPPICDPSADESLPVDVDRSSNDSYGIPELIRDLEVSSEESDVEEPREPGEPGENIEVDQSLSSDPDPSPTPDKSALDSQGFLNASDPPNIDPVSRPSLPDCDVSESSASNTIIILDSPQPSSLEEESVTDNTPTVSAENVPASTVSPDVENSSVPSTSNVPASSAAPSKHMGRRAPAPCPEPINFLNRVATSPVLVTSRPKPSAAPASVGDEMDTSTSLKRKPSTPPVKDKKGRKKGKK